MLDDQPEVSPAVEVILQQYGQLSIEEQKMLLGRLGLRASLQAWSEAIAEPAKDSSPVPIKPSYSAKLQLMHEDELYEGCINDAVTGCPWCRRPLKISTTPHLHRVDESPMLVDQNANRDRCAYTTLLYGPQCHEYFMGALVLGWGLRQYGGAVAHRVLLHTSDVPAPYLQALAASGWQCKEVPYLSSIARNLFHNYWKSRFIDVFTKLRALQLTEFDKVLLLDLDMLVRSAGETKTQEQTLAGIESLFDLEPPAAHKRGPPIPQHGDRVSYAQLWSHPERRKSSGWFEAIPCHQQGSGINAGVMLLRPDAAVFASMEAEVRDWNHPEHYATYMPEQEYLSRFYGTFDKWSHVDCRFNFEVDKNERVPHDFTEAHEKIRRAGHIGAVVLHYSGTHVKPWNLIFQKKGASKTLQVTSSDDLRPLFERLKHVSPLTLLEGYDDADRLWQAMLEWCSQFADVVDYLKTQEVDVIGLIHAAVSANNPGDTSTQESAAADNITTEKG